MGSLAVRALILISLAGGLIGSGYYRGYQDRGRADDLVRLHAVERTIQQAQEIAKQNADVSAGFETTQTRIQKVYIPVEKEVVREIPANCMQCRLTASGLMLLNSALAGNPVSAPAVARQLTQPSKPPGDAGGGDVPGDSGEAGGGKPGS